MVISVLGQPGGFHTVLKAPGLAFKSGKQSVQAV